MISDPATPHYNSWILSDLTMQTQHHHIAAALGDSRSLRDGIILLKVWLHQRQLDIVCSFHLLISLLTRKLFLCCIFVCLFFITVGENDVREKISWLIV